MKRDRLFTMIFVPFIMLIIAATPVLSATSSGSGFWIEEFAVKLFAMAQNVIIPCLLLGIVLVLGGGIGLRLYTMGPSLSYGLLGAFIIAGGVEAILLMTGSASASALTFVLPGELG